MPWIAVAASNGQFLANPDVADETKASFMRRVFNMRTVCQTRQEFCGYGYTPAQIGYTLASPEHGPLQKVDSSCEEYAREVTCLDKTAFCRPAYSPPNKLDARP